MKVYDAATIRNVAVVGHGGCGKTQLVSAMLCVAGEIVPIQLPMGEEHGFTGVVDLVRMKALTFAADSGKVTESDVPGEFADRAKEARDQLIEMVAEADEQLMEAFFAEGTLTQD